MEIQDPNVRQYLLNKLNSEYSDEALKAQQELAREQKSNASLGMLASGIGDALAGRSGASDAFYQGLNKNIDDQTVGAFNERKKMLESGLAANRQAQKDQRDDDVYDPNSLRSKSFRASLESMFPDVKKAYGENWNNVSAADQDSILQPLRMKETIEGRKAQMQQAQMLRNNDREMRSQDRKEIMEQKRQEKKEDQARLSTQEVSTLTDLDNAKSDLENILGQLGNKDSFVGPVDGRIPDLLSSEDKVAFRSAIGKYKDAYRKAVTGAGASAQEIARLETRLPSDTDTMANFVSKAKEALKEVDRRKGTVLTNYQKQGKNIDAFSSVAPASSPGGKVRVTNGTKTLMIDESDVSAAMKDGFQVVK